MATCFTLSLMFLLMTADVDGQQDVIVNYNPSYVCALRGSTVIMSCIYPPGHQVTSVYWTIKTDQPYSVPQNLCSDTYSREKVQCHKENTETYNITLPHVTEADKHEYCCIFTSGLYSVEFRGTPGVQLEVTDLQVETQQRVKERDSVTLTCKTTCRLTEETTFIWSRNTQILTEHTVNEFHLQSVSRHDSGLYRCAIRGHEHLSSPGVYLSVEYPPENTSASISSSGVIVEGDSVTLTCSSESNPPVHIYSWFKENQTSSVGSGQTFSITNINSRLSGWFYCVAQNKHGSQRSAAVSLTVKGVRGSSLYTVFGIVAGCVGFFIIIIIIIILIIKKRRTDSRAEYVNQTQTADSSDDRYTALKPASRTSADIYSTIRSDQCRADDGVYTTLDLQSRSSEYDTLAVNTH
ncbi:B-cell receptor CD22-like [Triplophysa rosa]|uniref:B-cell receptor CD22-like n=1 Tax=Triplophysa rosa TaxID=992332 RepID=UPI002545D57A|nr:B-cell receptor CD22-like [Triplophysa rosa]